MDRKLACRFPHYKPLNLDPESNSYVFRKVADSVQESQLQEIFNEIFAVDPVSGLPKGDLQYYLSKDGNPMVKQWLENNLLAPRAKQSGSSVEGVSDDLINEMSRIDGETTEDYRTRLQSIFDEAKSNYESLMSQQHENE